MDLEEKEEWKLQKSAGFVKLQNSMLVTRFVGSGEALKACELRNDIYSTVFNVTIGSPIKGAICCYATDTGFSDKTSCFCPSWTTYFLIE